MVIDSQTKLKVMDKSLYREVEEKEQLHDFQQPKWINKSTEEGQQIDQSAKVQSLDPKVQAEKLFDEET